MFCSEECMVLEEQRLNGLKDKPPTPSEIAEVCRQFQAGEVAVKNMPLVPWSDRERFKRAGMSEPESGPAVVEDMRRGRRQNKHD